MTARWLRRDRRRKANIPSSISGIIREKLPDARLYDLYAQYYSYGAEEKPKYEALFQAEQKVMKELAEKNSCVIVGRASGYVFRKYKTALHVFISAGMQHKIDRVVRRDGLDPKRSGEKKIKKVAIERKNHCRYFTGRDWGMAENYDLALRTDAFSVEDVADAIIEMSDKKLQGTVRQQKVIDIFLQTCQNRKKGGCCAINVRSLHRARTAAGIIAVIMLLAATFCVRRCVRGRRDACVSNGEANPLYKVRRLAASRAEHPQRRKSGKAEKEQESPGDRNHPKPAGQGYADSKKTCSDQNADACPGITGISWRLTRVIRKKEIPAKEPIGPGAKQKKAKVSSGATGTSTGIPEYKLTLKMAKKLKKELLSRGYKVKLIRTKHNVNISNSRRAKIANKAGADVFIRLHANASTNSRVKGALTISPTRNNRYCKSIYKKCRSLSKAVLSEFCEGTGAKNRGVMYTDTMSGINWSKVPVTIVEMGFLSNPKEDKKMNRSARYQNKMARGMANGIDRFLKRI